MPTPGPYAPPPLRVVQEFVNTVDRRRGREVLTTGRSLGRWLDAHDLLGHGYEVGDADLALALAVREGLRSLFDRHAGPAPDAADVLNDVVRRAGIVPYVNPSGVVRLKPTAGGAVGGLGRIAAIALLAQLDGSAVHLRACAAAECRSLFFAGGGRFRLADRCADPACAARRPRRARA